MKNIWKLLGAFIVLVSAWTWSQAVQTCQRTDIQCYEAGPSGNLSTTFRVDAAGNVTIAGTESVSGLQTDLGNTILGTPGTGTANTATAVNISNTVPVQVSTAISQGMVIIPTTQLVTGQVNGVMAATNNSTAVIGVADTAASSGTVVNVDFEGLSLALTSGTITVGDLLVSTVTWPGYLVTNNSAPAGAIVGTALATQAASYNGLTRVLLHH